MYDKPNVERHAFFFFFKDEGEMIYE